MLTEMSIQAYCSRNNIPYKVLDKWIGDIYKRVVPAHVTGTPEDLKTEALKQVEKVQEKLTSNVCGNVSQHQDQNQHEFRHRTILR